MSEPSLSSVIARQAEKLAPRPEELDVANSFGVSPVDWDTRLLATTAADLAARSVLDMGTGTGFVTIYLTLHGIDCDGIDINPAAVRCARENADRNRVHPAFRQADLFENLNRVYDLIVFNPPFGSSGSVGSSLLLETFKSLLPKEHPIVRRIAYRLIRAPRVRLIERFLGECRNHLSHRGRILILLHHSELQLTADFSVSVITQRDEFRLLLLEPTTGVAS